MQLNPLVNFRALDLYGAAGEITTKQIHPVQLNRGCSVGTSSSAHRVLAPCVLQSMTDELILFFASYIVFTSSCLHMRVGNRGRLSCADGSAARLHVTLKQLHLPGHHDLQACFTRNGDPHIDYDYVCVMSQTMEWE